MIKHLTKPHLIWVALVLTIVSRAWAVDVNGPYKNGQTSIEYIVNQDGSVSLYGINCRDNPKDADGFYLYNTIQPAQSIWSSGRFKDELDRPLEHGYPVLLSRNNALVSGEPNQYYSVSAITSDNHVYSLRRNDPFHFCHVYDHGAITAEIPTRVAASKSHLQNQWTGSNTFTQGPNSNPFMKSSDGWQTASQPILSPNQPWGDFEPVVYSLAIEDKPFPLQAMVVLTTGEITSHQFRQVRSRYRSQELPPAVYFSEDGGFTWRIPEGFPVIQPNNVQVAMVTCQENDPQCRNIVYVISDERGQFSCVWAYVDQLGNFEWHNEWPTGLPIIENWLPIEAMDLEATRLSSTTTTIRLVLATTRGVYLCDHSPETEEALNWVSADPNGTIETENLWDVALNPFSPANHFAVAGQAGCYETTDGGVNWNSIHNAEVFHTFASGGVRQSTSGMVAGYVEQTPLYGVHAVGDPSRNVYGVYVQLGPRQFGPAPLGRLTQIRQVGYAKAKECGPCGIPPSCSGISDTPGDVPLMAYSEIDQRFYIAYADAFISHTSNPCTGVVSVSADDGDNWITGEWSDCFFNVLYGQCHHAPIPASLVVDPSVGGRAYITFKDAVYQGGNFFSAPPFALTQDGGLTWSVSENDGLPPQDWSNLMHRPGYFLAAWSNQTSTVLWLVGRPDITYEGGEWSDARLWYSSDLGETWHQSTFSQGAELWRLPIGIVCQSENYQNIAVYGPDGIAFRYGEEWINTQCPLSEPFTDPEILDVIPDSRDGKLWWVSVRETVFPNDIQWLYAVRHRGSMDPIWTRVSPGWSINTEEIVNEVNTDLWLDSNEPNVRRIFWSLSSLPEQNGMNFLNSPTVKRLEFTVLPETIGQSMTVSDPVVYMMSNVDISPTTTLTLASGVCVYAAPGCTLRVQGSLVAENGCSLKALDSTGVSSAWSGIYVNGSITLTNTTLSGATTGIETSKATHVTLDGCTITDCGTGLIAYQPSGTAIAQVMECTFTVNELYGASLLSTASVTFDDCNFTGNGADGMLLTNSYAKVISCDFTDNGTAQGGYGLNCFGSSPMLSCNSFDENFKGEIVLYNQSYPAMEPSGGGGKNTLFNSTKNLIDMWSSYPLTKSGHNNFTVGSTGYYMADMSTSPKQRDISANFWNPSLSLSKLYPSSSNVYTWSSTDAVPSTCGTGTGASMSAPQLSFADATAEQSTGNYLAANALFTEVATLYPDSEWAAPALAQMFATQCMIGDGFMDLQTYMNELESASLEESSEEFATRLWTEDAQYGSALATYEATMANAPTEVDSAFAAVDYAVTSFRSQSDGGSLDATNDVSVGDVFRQIGAISTTIPPSPEASHEGFSVIPSTVALEPNFPNPFNAETTIRYYLPEAQFAEISIFNIVGQKVATLVSGQMNAGFHNVHWSGSDLASGVYLYQLKAGGAVETKKMVLIK